MADFDLAAAALKPFIAGTEKVPVSGDGVPAALTVDQMGAYYSDRIAALNGLSGRNLLINPRGRINQRGYVSGTAVSGAGTYTLDRWRVVAGGEALSWTLSGGSALLTAPAGGVEQVIEGANIPTGTHVISFTGTASCLIDGVPKVSGETVDLTAGENVVVRFSGGTVFQPCLERGQNPRPVEVRPESVEHALSRYYYQHVVVNNRSYLAVDTYNIVSIQFVMRATPTAVIVTEGFRSGVRQASLFPNSRYGAVHQIQAAETGNVLAWGEIVAFDAEL